jgi:hypothetical protein
MLKIWHLVAFPIRNRRRTPRPKTPQTMSHIRQTGLDRAGQRTGRAHRRKGLQSAQPLLGLHEVSPLPLHPPQRLMPGTTGCHQCPPLSMIHCTTMYCCFPSPRPTLSPDIECQVVPAASSLIPLRLRLGPRPPPPSPLPGGGAESARHDLVVPRAQRVRVRVILCVSPPPALCPSSCPTRACAKRRHSRLDNRQDFR